MTPVNYLIAILTGKDKSAGGDTVDSNKQIEENNDSNKQVEVKDDNKQVEVKDDNKQVEVKDDNKEAEKKKEEDKNKWPR